jgi:hypothetical protein
MKVDRSSTGAIKPYVRRVAAAATATTILALTWCDLRIPGFRSWWNRHSLTGSILGNLLVVGATALILDEVIARHQRRERAISVAVQGMILYAQARRAFDGVLASIEQPSGSGGALEEMRPLASMLLDASPSLFDDPTARRFLQAVQRLTGALLQTISASPERARDPQRLEILTNEMSELQTTVEPLRARLPVEYRSMLDEPT